MCVCKQTHTPYAFTHLWNVNRHCTCWDPLGSLSALLTERVVWSLTLAAGTCWHSEAIRLRSRAPRGASSTGGALPEQPPSPRLLRSLERLESMGLEQN